VFQTEGAKFFAFSYVELPAGASPWGRIYITNPGTRVAYVHVRTPLLQNGTAGYFSKDLCVWPGNIANVTIPYATFLAGCMKDKKGSLYKYRKLLFIIKHLHHTKQLKR